MVSTIDQDLSITHNNCRPIMAHVYAEMIITHLRYIPMSEREVHNGETTLIILVFSIMSKSQRPNAA
ncbi:MAG: hypothetical protein CMJ21_03175 [Phycisphaerae bacterium]|jgi:hypothetical protein|nr:hypothetical protein [Phycisphaerae bacterium]